MIQDDVNKFFANKPNPPVRMKLGGKKLSVSNLSNEDQEKIRQRLIEKDPVMKLGNEGILPGIKIDGKEVTRENIHEFEISKKPEKKDKLEEIIEPKKETKTEPKVEIKETKKEEKKTTKKSKKK